MNKKKKRVKGRVADITDLEKEALALVETRGKTGTIGSLDLMPKTSEVNFVRRVNIGTGMVTVVYMGEVAAARSAHDAASNLARKISEFITSNVIPRPHERTYSLLQQASGEQLNMEAGKGKKMAVGMVETEGFVGMLEAADKGIKAADVQIPGWVTVGGSLTSVFYRGEVAAVHSAVEAGVIAASDLTNVVATHVIPQPDKGTEQSAPIGKFSGKSVFDEVDDEAALGILETRGITGLIEGIDAGLKAASVIVQGWEKIGRGITSTLFRGTVADVRSAMDAAKRGATDAGEVVGTYVIARPHAELEKGR
ncbi:MAG: BMC domain-containing protein [Elusimicrobiota bacterium]